MVDLLLEIGTEELPTTFIGPALAFLESQLKGRLEALGLDCSNTLAEGTPRRLLVCVWGIAARQADREEEIVGPPKRIALDADGNPTKAGLGFAKRQGVDPSQLYVVDTPKGDYLATNKKTVGRPAIDLLRDELPRILGQIPFPKSMRWHDNIGPFARPIHWIVALADQQTIEFEFLGVKSGNQSRGHRFSAPESFEVTSINQYQDELDQRFVVISNEKRKALIVAESRRLAESVGGKLLEDEQLLETVSYLNEDPVPYLGQFKHDYLKLPNELLTTSMKSHQKYFSIVDNNGDLLPFFVLCANTRVKDPAVVVAGNERVLQARLADAEFFWDTDLKHSLESYFGALGGRIFLRGLGSVADKAERIEVLAARIAELVGCAEIKTVQRAARLAKCDLATDLVAEFADLQGVIGREYAKMQGETDAVANAIFEHYLPRGASDDLPPSEIGAIVSLADKIDTICGCFGLGLVVSGTQDPYALRRQILGIMRIVMHRAWDLDIRDLPRLAMQTYHDRGLLAEVDGDAVVERIVSFARERFKHSRSTEFPADVIEAVLSARFDKLGDALERVRALAKLKEEPEFESLAAAWKRMANITRKNPIDSTEVLDQLLTEDAEVALYAVAQRVKLSVDASLKDWGYAEALNEMLSLKPAVDRFFEDVLVMDKDQKIRRNRLALLLQTQKIFKDIANFTALQ